MRFPAVFSASVIAVSHFHSISVFSLAAQRNSTTVRASPVPGLTRRGLGRLSSSQMAVSSRPKSFPGAADVEERGALSKWVPGPRQKAQFMMDLFLLNDFWLKSGKRERCLLEEMHFNSNSSICFAVVAMVSKEKMSWTQPTSWHPARPNPPCAYLCVCVWLRPNHALRRITKSHTAQPNHCVSTSARGLCMWLACAQGLISHLQVWNHRPSLGKVHTRTPPASPWLTVWRYPTSPSTVMSFCCCGGQR